MRVLCSCGAEIGGTINRPMPTETTEVTDSSFVDMAHHDALGQRGTPCANGGGKPQAILDGEIYDFERYVKPIQRKVTPSINAKHRLPTKRSQSKSSRRATSTVV